MLMRTLHKSLVSQRQYLAHRTKSTFDSAPCVYAAETCFPCRPKFHRRTSACSCCCKKHDGNITYPTTIVLSMCVGAWEESTPFSWHSLTRARDVILLLQRHPKNKKKRKQLRRIRTSKRRTEPRTKRDAPTQNAQREETLNTNDSF